MLTWNIEMFLSESWWSNWQIDWRSENNRKASIVLVFKKMKNCLATTLPIMTPLQTQHIVIPMQCITLLNHLELKTHYACGLSSKTKQTPYLPYNSFILHVNHYYSSAVLSISYDPAEYKMIFFTHGTAPVGLISPIKFYISLVEKWEFGIGICVCELGSISWINIAPDNLIII